MELQDFASKFDDQLQRLKYAIKYGQWYDDNKVYFEQFINLRREKLIVDECSNEFSRLQEFCGLDEDDETLCN